MATARIRVTLQPAVGQSVSPSWRRALFGAYNQILLCCQTIMALVFMRRPLNVFMINMVSGKHTTKH
jgi:hypothetical protein